MSEPMKVLDLFSGIGGFSLGLERTGGFKTVAFCEIEEFPRRVLAKHWPDIPIHHDIRKLKAEHVGAVDVICGGYPCQPFSVAGERAGEADDRHLWPEMRRLVDELGPAWVIGENVAGHISMGLDDVLSDLEARSYSCRTFAIPALAVDARHQRFRTWIVAHGGRHGHGTLDRPWEDPITARETQGARHQREWLWVESGRSGADLADPDRCHAQRELAQRDDAEDGQEPFDGQIGLLDRAWGYREWPPEPDVGRVAHGVPSRVDRLRGLGNAVVPQIPEIIGRAILAAEAA